MRAYSMDLRERVVAAVDAGMTQSQAAARFGVSLRTVERYLARRQVAADATLAEHAAAVSTEHGVAVSLATMSRAITTLPADDPAQVLTPSGRRRRPGRPLKQRP